MAFSSRIQSIRLIGRGESRVKSTSRSLQPVLPGQTQPEARGQGPAKLFIRVTEQDEENERTGLEGQWELPALGQSQVCPCRQFDEDTWARLDVHLRASTSGSFFFYPLVSFFLWQEGSYLQGWHFGSVKSTWTLELNNICLKSQLHCLLNVGLGSD